MYHDNRPFPPRWWRKVDRFIFLNWFKILLAVALAFVAVSPFIFDAPTFYWVEP